MLGQPITKKFIGDLENDLVLAPQGKTSRLDPRVKVLLTNPLFYLPKGFIPNIRHGRVAKRLNYRRKSKNSYTHSYPQLLITYFLLFGELRETRGRRRKSAQDNSFTRTNSSVTDKIKHSRRNEKKLQAKFYLCVGRDCHNPFQNSLQEKSPQENFFLPRCDFLDSSVRRC